MVIVDCNMKEEMEYSGRLCDSLSGVGSNLIIFMTLVLKYLSNVFISVVMGSFGSTRCDILPSSWLEMEKSFLELVDASFNRLLLYDFLDFLNRVRYKLRCLINIL